MLQYKMPETSSVVSLTCNFALLHQYATIFIFLSLLTLHVSVSCSHLHNSVALVRERTIPTERPSLVGEDSANFDGWRCDAWLVLRILTAVISVFLTENISDLLLIFV
jgi:hypothetical protein